MEQRLNFPVLHFRQSQGCPSLSGRAVGSYAFLPGGKEGSKTLLRLAIIFCKRNFAGKRFCLGSLEAHHPCAALSQCHGDAARLWESFWDAAAPGEGTAPRSAGAVVYLRVLTPGPLLWFLLCSLWAGSPFPQLHMFFSTAMHRSASGAAAGCWCLASSSSSLVPLSGGREAGSLAGCFPSPGATSKTEERLLVLLAR